MMFEFTRRFCMGHRLTSNESPKCQTPHGHNEFVILRLRVPEAYILDLNINMPASFEGMKKRWHDFVDNHLDHSLQLNKDDLFYKHIRMSGDAGTWRIVVTPGDPTTECVAACLFSKAQALVAKDAPHMIVGAVSLEETPTNKVVVTSRLGLPDGNQYWFNRADTSTRDDL